MPNVFTGTADQIENNNNKINNIKDSQSPTTEYPTVEAVKNYTAGEKVVDGGEIFNDYENNKALSEYSTASGSNTIAGCKGFKILDIRLESSTSDFEQYILYISDTSELTTGDILSIHSDMYSGSYESVGTIENIIDDTSIEVKSTGTTLNSILNGVMEELENYPTYIWFSNKLDINGDKDIGAGASATGVNTLAVSLGAHAEGIDTLALNDGAHAEGIGTIASGSYAHAEGGYTTVDGEKKFNIASGGRSHVEGSANIASAYDAHAEGSRNIASANQAHAEGFGTQAMADQSHSEGNGTKATADAAHSEGYETEANGQYSHSEGHKTIANGNGAHSEGSNTRAIAASSHAEGMTTSAEQDGAHAEGMNTTAKGYRSHAEGQSTIKAENFGSVDDVYSAWKNANNNNKFSYALGTASHNEGINSLALHEADHAEGLRCVAKGPYAHAGGQDTCASGNCSFTMGLGTKTHVAYQTAFGKYNKTDAEALFMIGNGSSDANKDRKNAFVVKKDGTATIQSTSDTDDSAVVNLGQLKDYTTNHRNIFSGDELPDSTDGYSDGDIFIVFED